MSGGLSTACAGEDPQAVDTFCRLQGVLLGGWAEWHRGRGPGALRRGENPATLTCVLAALANARPWEGQMLLTIGCAAGRAVSMHLCQPWHHPELPKSSPAGVVAS